MLAAGLAHVAPKRTSSTGSALRSVNVDGTLRLARQAAALGVRRFVFISSAKVNGDSTAPGQAFRFDDIAAPKDMYGLSKHDAECGLRAIGIETGLEVVIVRRMLVYGPGVKANFRRMM